LAKPVRVADTTSAVFGRLPLYAIWVGYGALAVVGLGLWLLVILQSGSFATYTARADFAGSYTGASAVWSGSSARLYDVPTQESIHAARIAPYGAYSLPIFNYPAWNAVLLAPLAELPYPIAFALWLILNLLAAGVALVMLVRSTASSVDAYTRVGLTALACWPLTLTLLEGQMGVLVWLGLVGGLTALQRGHDRQAGAWLLLGLVKPQLLVLPLLALLLSGRHRALAAFCAGALGILAGSVAIAGNWLPSYAGLLVNFVQPEAKLGDLPELMVNWRGLVFALPNSSQSVANLLAIVLGAGSLAVFAALARRYRAAGPEVVFGISILVGLLLNPHLYLYDTVIAITTGLVLWRATEGVSHPTIHLLRAVLLVGPPVTLLAGFWNPPHVALGAWYQATVLLAAFAAWRQLGQSRQSSGLPAPAHRAPA
jgi:hypothetical protein